MRYFTLSILLVINFALLGQLEIVSKGKKQGLRSFDSGNWVIPLEKQIIHQITDDYYACFDQRNLKVIGYTIIDGSVHKTYPTDNLSLKFHKGHDFYLNYIRFGNLIIDKDKKGFGSSDVLLNPGNTVCSINQYFFLISEIDFSTNFQNITIKSLNKCRDLISLEKVKCRLSGNNLYVLNSFDANGSHQKLTIINLATCNRENMNNLDVRELTPKDQDFQMLSNWFYQDKSQTTENLNPENSKTFLLDSIANFDLVHSLGDNNLYVSEDEQKILSSSGIFDISIRKETVQLGDYHSNQIINVWKDNNHLIVEDFSYGSSQEKFDWETGMQVYDDYGNPIYEDIIGYGKSGVWSIPEKKWIIDTNHMYISTINNQYLTDHVEFVARDNSIIIDTIFEELRVYSMDGSEYETFSKSKIHEVAKFIFKADSSKVLADNITYELFKEDSVCIVKSDLGWISHSDVIASYSDQAINSTYNPDYRVFFSQKNDKIYFNKFYPDFTTISYPVDSNFYGFDFNSNLHQPLYFSSNDPVKKMVYGLEKLGNLVIITNVTETVIEEFPLLDWETGFELYNEDGDVIMDAAVDKGQFHTGLWDMDSKQWLIPPKFRKISKSNGGFIAEEYVEYFSDRVEHNLTITNLDSVKINFWIYNNEFNLIQKISEEDQPFDNPKYFKYFSDISDIQGVITKPVCMNNEPLICKEDLWMVKTNNGYSVLNIDILNQSINLEIHDAVWANSSYESFQWIKHDSIFFKHSNSPNEFDYAVPNVSGIKNFDFYESYDLILLRIGKDSIYLSKSNDILEIIKKGNSSLGEVLSSIVYRKDKVLCTNRLSAFLEYYDEYDFYTDFQIQPFSDILWSKNMNLFKVEYSASNISEVMGGYKIDKNYAWFDDGFEPSDIEFIPIIFCDNDFQKVPYLVEQCLERQQKNGYEVCTYINEYGMEVFAFYNEKNKIVAKDIYDYQVSNNIIKCFLIDNENGFELYDQDGNIQSTEIPILK